MTINSHTPAVLRVGADYDALTAPVCVCMYPKPDPIGECQQCGRPYHPTNRRHMAIRTSWRTSGLDCEPDPSEDEASWQLTMFPDLVPATPWP